MKAHDYVYKWCKATLNSHKKRKYEVMLTDRELYKIVAETPNCNYCNIKLNWEGTGGLQPDSPTLDRIDNDNVICKDNVQILCHRCNATKGDRTNLDFINYCKYIAIKYKSIKYELYVPSSTYNKRKISNETHIDIINDFLLKNIVYGNKNDYVSKSDLYDRYIMFCNAKGFPKIDNLIGFGMIINRSNFSGKSLFRYDKNHIQKKMWVGIKFIDRSIS